MYVDGIVFVIYNFEEVLFCLSNTLNIYEGRNRPKIFEPRADPNPILINPMNEMN